MLRDWRKMKALYTSLFMAIRPTTGGSDVSKKLSQLQSISIPLLYLAENLVLGWIIYQYQSPSSTRIPAATAMTPSTMSLSGMEIGKICNSPQRSSHTPRKSNPITLADFILPLLYLEGIPSKIPVRKI
jgi:hypothetical protein